MKDNLIYLYPAQNYDIEETEKREFGIQKVGHVVAKIIELFAAVGIFLCVGICTLLFFTML